ncbi:MAG TPA: hypothetical protein VKB12_09750, partial [Pyrinomonadaceae bacterium]|nr:hypothetical protein [Pyrinomonadaceae bacterium]
INCGGPGVFARTPDGVARRSGGRGMLLAAGGLLFAEFMVPSSLLARAGRICGGDESRGGVPSFGRI